MSRTQILAAVFNFKTRKIVDDEGKEIGRTMKQPQLKAELPVPTNDVLVEILSSNDPAVEKQKVLILDAVYAIFKDQAKSMLDEKLDSFAADSTEVITADAIDYAKLSLEYIASLPPAQRGARPISDEEWTFFFEDYKAVMVAATGKPEKAINNHLEIFKKPAKYRNNDGILAVLVEALDVYLAKSAVLEETGDAASRTRQKFAKWREDNAKIDINAL